MNRIDRLVLVRLATRIGVTLFVFYGLITLVESLETWRFNLVAENHGVVMAVVMVAMSGVKWAIKTMPVTVLMGAILGFIELKSRQEMTVIQATGISPWRVIRAPAIALAIMSLVISLGLETFSTSINRWLNPTPIGQISLLTPAGEIWLEQRGDNAHYVIMARSMQEGGSVLHGVTLFHLDGNKARIEGDETRLIDGRWTFPTAIERTPDRAAQTLTNYAIPTYSSAAEIDLKLSSTEDLSFFELAQLLSAGVADPDVRSAATMRAFKLLSTPLVLVGSLFIAFAFTAGYRRTANFGPAILYGIVLGFVVFVITEMADRAGSSGVLDPTFAAIGPAFVAIVIGATVLLHKEDGRR